MIDLILFLIIGGKLDILNGWYLTLIIIKGLWKAFFWSMIFMAGSTRGEK